jgi:hypothetical protein
LSPEVFLLWLIGAVVLLTVVVSAIAIFIVRKSGAGKAQPQAGDELRKHFARLEGEGLALESRLLCGTVARGEHAGRSFEHYMLQQGKDLPPEAVVSIPTAAPGAFEVRPEGADVVMAKELGMVDELQTGDPALDRKMYFSGITDEYVRAVFGVRDNLDIVRRLLAQGFHRIEKTTDRLTAWKVQPEPLALRDLKAAVEQLAAFSLPPTVEGSRAFQGRKALYAMRTVILVACLLGVTGFVITQPLTEGWGAFLVKTAPYNLAICAAMVAGAWIWLRGRSMSVGGMVELLLYLPLLAVALVGTLALANEHLDRAAASEHVVKVVSRTAYQPPARRSGQQSVVYNVEFESWRGRTHQNMAVSWHIFSDAREGSTWVVRTRPGSLGQEWIEWLECLEPVEPRSKMPR